MHHLLQRSSTRSSRFRRLALTLVSFSIATGAQGIDVDWTGAAGPTINFWDVPSNWSSNPLLPGAGDNARIGAAFTPEHRSGNNAISSLQANGSLTLSGGTLTLNGDSFVNNVVVMRGVNTALFGSGNFTAGALNWIGTSGAMRGTGTTTVTGAATFGDGVDFSNHSLGGGRVLNLNGTTNFRSFALTFDGTATLNNNGTFNNYGRVDSGLPPGENVFQPLGTGTRAFNNFATYNQASGTTLFDRIRFNNIGSANVNVGTLALYGGGVSSGLVNIDAGGILKIGANYQLSGSIVNAGALEILAGTTTVTATASHSGPGKVNITGGIFDLEPIFRSPFSRITGGTVGGRGTLDVDNLEWLGGGGRMDGPGTTKVNVTANLGDGVGFSQQTLRNGWTLKLGGVANFQSSRLNIESSGGTIENTGILYSKGNVQGTSVTDNSIQGFGNSIKVFNNLGTIIQNSAGAATSVNGVTVNSSGDVIVRAGALALNAGGTSSGGFATDPNATLTFGGGMHTLSGNILNAGKLVVSAGTVALTNTATLADAGETWVAGGVLDGSASSAPLVFERLRIGSSGMYRVSATWTAKSLDWTTGTIQGTGSGTVSGPANLGDGASLSAQTLSGGAAVVLNGDTTWRSDNLTFGTGGATLTNAGKFHNLGSVVGSSVFNNSMRSSGSGDKRFVNTGFFLQNTSNRATTVTVYFVNSRTVNVTSGSLALIGGGDSSGEIVVNNGATLELGGGEHAISGDVANAGTFGVSGTGTQLTLSGRYSGPGSVRIRDGITRRLDSLHMLHYDQSGGRFVIGDKWSARTFDWNGGQIEGRGEGTITAAATLGDGATPTDQTLAGGHVLNLNGATVFRSNSLVLGAGDATVNNAGTFTSSGNVQGAFVFDNTIIGLGDGNHTFFNTGFYIQNSRNAATTVRVKYFSSGTTLIDTGKLKYEDDVFFSPPTNLGGSSGGSVGARLAAGAGPKLVLPIRSSVNDDLDINARATLAGDLVLDFSFAPRVGDVITVFSYDERSGTFDTITGTGLATGFVLRPIYNADHLQVEVLAVPEPRTYAMMVAGLAVVLLVARRRSRA